MNCPDVNRLIDLTEDPHSAVEAEAHRSYSQKLFYKDKYILYSPRELQLPAELATTNTRFCLDLLQEPALHLWATN